MRLLRMVSRHEELRKRGILPSSSSSVRIFQTAVEVTKWNPPRATTGGGAGLAGTAMAGIRSAGGGPGGATGTGGTAGAGRGMVGTPSGPSASIDRAASPTDRQTTSTNVSFRAMTRPILSREGTDGRTTGRVAG